MTLGAQAGPPTVEDLLKTPSHTDSQILWQIGIVLLAAVAVGALLFLIVYFVKRKDQPSVGETGDHRHHHHHHSAPDESSPKPESSHRSGFRLFGRRRRRYRRHRPRFPTLADTGGLPPVRDDESVNPPP